MNNAMVLTWVALAGVLLVSGCGLRTGSFEFMGEEEVDSCFMRGEELQRDELIGRRYQITSTCDSEREWRYVYEIEDVTFREESYESVSPEGDASIVKFRYALPVVAFVPSESDIPDDLTVIYKRDLSVEATEDRQLESPCNGPDQEWTEENENGVGFSTGVMLITIPEGGDENIHSFDTLEILGEKSEAPQQVTARFDNPCDFVFAPYVGDVAD